MIPEGSPENHFSIDADDIIDVALHHEIKFRAYELYERRHDTADGHELKEEFTGRTAPCCLRGSPASKVLQWRGRDTRAVRAARIYLRALSSFIGERDMD
jgi:hypothetical protein